MKSTDSSNPAEKTLIHKQLNHSLEGKKPQQNNALLANSSGILCPGRARSFPLCRGKILVRTSETQHRPLSLSPHGACLGTPGFQGLRQQHHRCSQWFH